MSIVLAIARTETEAVQHEAQLTGHRIIGIADAYELDDIVLGPADQIRFLPGWREGRPDNGTAIMARLYISCQRLPGLTTSQLGPLIGVPATLISVWKSRGRVMPYGLLGGRGVRGGQGDPVYRVTTELLEYAATYQQRQHRKATPS